MGSREDIEEAIKQQTGRTSSALLSNLGRRNTLGRMSTAKLDQAKRLTGQVSMKRPRANKNEESFDALLRD